MENLAASREFQMTRMQKVPRMWQFSQTSHDDIQPQKAAVAWSDLHIYILNGFCMGWS